VIIAVPPQRGHYLLVTRRRGLSGSLGFLLTARKRYRVHVPGIRQPIVIVLLLIAFFSAISGKPLDGLLTLLVAAGLAWDAARASSREAAIVPPGGGGILEVAATRTRAQVPSLGDVLTRIMRTRTGRVGVLVAWAWLGLHFFSQ
jgi:Family of unknown function (DUF6186)